MTTPTPPEDMRMCGTCASWHKRDNYACQFNGPYGGGVDGVEGCKWVPSRAKCPRCGAEMTDGMALESTVTGSPDFIGGEVVTLSPGGPGKLVACMKCIGCGYSTT